MFDVLRFFLDLLFIFYISMWIIFPAYLANAVAVPVSKNRNFHPIDNGKMLLGQRIFGDGKTIEGFLLASAIGCIGGLVQVLVSPLFLAPSLAWHDFYGSFLVPSSDITQYISASVPSIVRAVIFPPGAMLGDLLGSFIKRRLKIQRGDPAPVLDQLDFIAGVLLFSMLFTAVGASFLQLDIKYLVTILVLTPFIHRVVNKLAFKLRVKDVPH
ncbi:MAG TPA: CDP-2,3-bis-(O-geranylgeranyl)-sn-glycerol synthase [Candidatus Lokiarchaeia archaeon]|nr:CDP-2,3-bis-(O-geranylgeranyl)-sn-glycerol synthase [Candidatus Lokiarchaeia archaeon]